MNRFSAIIFALLLCLCSCEEHTQNPVGTPLPLPASIASESASVSESGVLINWGSSTDPLKQFADHDGNINQYKDYTITVQYAVGEIKSEPLELTWEGGLGSQLLTGLHRLTPQEEHPEFPLDVPSVTLSVTDNEIEYQYTAYEDGELYTVQNGKTYFLGNAGIEFSSLQGHFVTAALNGMTPEQAGTTQLPPFDPFNDSVKFNESVSGKTPVKTNYSPDRYDVAVELPNYAERSTPIIIKEKNAEKVLLDILNQCTDVAEPELSTGGGQIIRVFNDNECFDYMVKNEILFDYNNGLLLKMPDNPIGAIYSAMAYELMLLSGESESLPPLVSEQDVLMTQHTPQGDTDIDLSTLQKVHDFADIVVVGTVGDMTFAEYRPEYRNYGDVPLSTARITCTKVIKGSVQNELPIYICGGYVRAEDYIEYQVRRSEENGTTRGQTLSETFPASMRANKFFKVKYCDSPELKNEGTYTLFLKQWEDGRITPVGCDLEIIEMQGDTALYSGDDFETLEVLGIIQPTV